MKIISVTKITSTRSESFARLKYFNSSLGLMFFTHKCTQKLTTTWFHCFPEHLMFLTVINICVFFYEIHILPETVSLIVHGCYI